MRVLNEQQTTAREFNKKADYSLQLTKNGLLGQKVFMFNAWENL